MAEYIDINQLWKCETCFHHQNGHCSPSVWCDHGENYRPAYSKFEIADVAPVVRCQNCIHAEPLDRNCEINTSVYMHCKIQRGEETKNVWHKYKKYYKDYSLVDRDGFCDEGARMDGE